jgi:hypothetical protein
VSKPRPSLLDEVKAYVIRTGPTCSVCRLPVDLRAEVDAVLRERGACHAAMAAALKKWGHSVSRERIGHHYREGHHAKG